MKKNITESQLVNLVKRLIKESNDTYFETFSAAVQYARQNVENKGYEINEDDWWSQINIGQGKPKEGQTTRATIGLLKNGKPIRRSLQIQVYNMGLSYKNNYELNYYIS